MAQTESYHSNNVLLSCFIKTRLVICTRKLMTKDKQDDVTLLNSLLIPRISTSHSSGIALNIHFD